MWGACLKAPLGAGVPNTKVQLTRPAARVACSPEHPLILGPGPQPQLRARLCFTYPSDLQQDFPRGGIEKLQPQKKRCRNHPHEPVGGAPEEKALSSRTVARCALGFASRHRHSRSNSAHLVDSEELLPLRLPAESGADCRACCVRTVSHRGLPAGGAAQCSPMPGVQGVIPMHRSIGLRPWDPALQRCHVRRARLSTCSTLLNGATDGAAAGPSPHARLGPHRRGPAPR